MSQTRSWFCFLLQTSSRFSNSAGAPHPSACGSDPVSSGPASGAAGSAQLPTGKHTGSRKAKVLYDYDAHDTSELSLLADEVKVLVLVLSH